MLIFVLFYCVAKSMKKKGAFTGAPQLTGIKSQYQRKFTDSCKSNKNSNKNVACVFEVFGYSLVINNRTRERERGCERGLMVFWICKKLSM